MHTSYQVFQTTSASRWRRFKWTTRIFIFVGVFFLFVLVLAIIKNVNPSLPTLEEKARYYQKILQPKGEITFAHPANKAYQGFKDVLKNKSLPKSEGPENYTNQIRAAFYTPWRIDSKITLSNLATNAIPSFPNGSS